MALAAMNFIQSSTPRSAVALAKMARVDQYLGVALRSQQNCATRYKHTLCASDLTETSHSECDYCSLPSLPKGQ